VLLVSDSLRPFEVLESSWAIVGPGHRDLWAAYARDLSLGRAEQFLRDRHIGAAEREDVEAALGVSPETHLLGVKAALLAIWRRSHRDEGIEEFHSAWKRHATGASAVAEWLSSPQLEATLVRARGLPEEEASLSVLSAAGLAVVDWQAARQELGVDRWTFDASGALFAKARDILAACLMSVAVHIARIDLDVARGVITRLRQSEAEPAIRECPPDEARVLQAVTQCAQDLMNEPQHRADLQVLSSRLEKLQTELPKTIEVLLIEGATKREVELYCHESEDRRKAAAEETTNGLLRVAAELAKVLGEPLDASAIKAAPRVHALSSGWWANRFAVLAAIKDAIGGGRHRPQPRSQMQGASGHRCLGSNCGVPSLS
jgi:hypothetical protein